MEELMGFEDDTNFEQHVKRQLNMMNFNRIYKALSKLTERWSKDPLK
jgi:hypothetical protein